MLKGLLYSCILCIVFYDVVGAIVHKIWSFWTHVTYTLIYGRRLMKSLVEGLRQKSNKRRKIHSSDLSFTLVASIQKSQFLIV